MIYFSVNLSIDKLKVEEPVHGLSKQEVIFKIIQRMRFVY